MQNPKADVFRAVSDPNRRQILNLLSKDCLTINALAANFRMSRPAVSKHIKILDSAGFISIENIGRERYCLLRQKGFEELEDWVGFFDNFWKTKLKKLESLLNEKTGK